VVHQQGGWWCWDEYSCDVRWAHFPPGNPKPTERRSLMSSKPIKEMTALHNTFNGEQNPTWGMM